MSNKNNHIPLYSFFYTYTQFLKLWLHFSNLYTQKTKQNNKTHTKWKTSHISCKRKHL